MGFVVVVRPQGQHKQRSTEYTISREGGREEGGGRGGRGEGGGGREGGREGGGGGGGSEKVREGGSR